MKSSYPLPVISYLRLCNPSIVVLLTFTAVAAGISAGGLNHPWQLLSIGMAVTLCSMGARSLTNYVDRDMDAQMERTRNRPIPSGRISPPNALAFGVSITGVGLASAFPIGSLYVLLLFLGLLDNIVVYNLMTKKRTPWNIVLGAPSGGIPALVGYAAILGRVDLVGLCLAALVVLWTPIHIWSLAIRYRDDYARANVPMLPVKLGVAQGIRCIAVTSLFLAIFTMMLPFLPGSPFGALTLWVATVLGIALLVLSLHLIHKPTPENSWRLFKFTSPYLALIFTVMAANVVFGLAL